MLELIVKRCAEIDSEEEKQPEEEVKENINKMLLKKKTTFRNVMTYKIMFVSKIVTMLRKLR